MGMLRSPWQAKPPAPPHSRLLSSAELFRLRQLLALLAQNSLAAELDLVAFERQNLDQNLVAFLQLVAHFAHAVLGDLADVQQAVGAGEDLDESAEIHQPHDLAQVGLAHFGHRGDVADDLERLVGCGFVGGRNMHGAVIVHVDLHAGLLDDAANHPNIAGGMWAEYLVTSAQLCVPLSKQVDMEQGATMLVNPLTALALMEEARLGRHRAIVQTAAASALGRMVVRLSQKFSIPTINVVRRAEQVDLLRKMGAEHVLNTSDPGFDASLAGLCHRLGASIGFDAVAGEMSARVLRAQPRGSRLLVYGALSLEASQIDPASLIFEGKRVEGFWLTAWLRQRNMLSQLRVTRHVQQMLAGDLQTEIRARLPLKEIAHGLEQYASKMTGGKILLLPLTQC